MRPLVYLNTDPISTLWFELALPVTSISVASRPITPLARPPAPPRSIR
jgi:hypothetical protein